jgi:hypothetical protein
VSVGGTAGVTGGGASSGGMSTAGSGNGPGSTSVVVTVLPSAKTVMTSATVQLSASYTAPGAVPDPNYCHVRATSNADANAYGAATLAITDTASVGEPGVWVRADIPVTINDGSSAGAQTVLVDPVRPSDFYVFLSVTNSTPMMVLKSTDFGVTWTDMNTTADLHGNPWGAGIDPNPNRDPKEPPTLYTPAGFGNPGVWKSTDGGVTWQNKLAGSVFDDKRDCYQIAVLPDDPPNHLLFTYHYNWPNSAEAGFGESTDGGATWMVHPPPAGIGVSHYLMILDANTWLSIAQGNGGANGIWKTTTAGRVDGEISTQAWAKVDTLEHAHGAWGAYIDPASGTIVSPGEGNVKKSTDQGETWEFISQGQGICNVVATESYYYGNCLSGPNLLRAARSADTVWESYAVKPNDMTQGSPPFGSAPSFDGTHWIIVMDADDNGVWRYVEP